MERLGSRRVINRAVVLGIVLAIGTFSSGWIVADSVLMGWAGWLVYKRQIAIPWWLIVLAGTVTLSAVLGSDRGTTLYMAGHILLLGIVGIHIHRSGVRPGDIAIGMVIGLVAQTAGLLAAWSVHRPSGFALNASQLGQTGLAVLMVTPRFGGLAGIATAAITIGVSQSRAAVAAGALFTAASFRKDRWIVFLVVASVFVIAAISQGPDALKRLGISIDNNSRSVHTDQIEGTISTRVDLIFAAGYPGRAGVVAEAVLDNVEPPELRAPRFTLTGYGLGGYVQGTGLVRPHNIPVLMAFEMGLLTLGPLLVLAWAVWRRYIPIPVIVGWIGLWMIVEEPTARLEGHFLIAAVIIGSLALAREPARRSTARPGRRVPGLR
jgi:hypothetical protein